jgi:hypothetical protein
MFDSEICLTAIKEVPGLCEVGEGLESGARVMLVHAFDFFELGKTRIPGLLFPVTMEAYLVADQNRQDRGAPLKPIVDGHDVLRRRVGGERGLQRC